MEHVPNRPAWDCAVCGKDWPCDPAREELATEHHDDIGVRLAMAAWDYFEAFCFDRPNAPSADLFERFIAWTRQPPAMPDAAR